MKLFNKKSKQTFEKPTSSADVEQWIRYQLVTFHSVMSEQLKGDVPFGELGFDSMAAVRFTSDIEEWLEIEVDPTLLFTENTVDTLTTALGNRLKL